MAAVNEQIIEYTVLRSGRVVPTSRYQSLRDHVGSRVSVLEPCRPYTLKMICGDTYWSRLGGFRTFAGMIMAELVEDGLVPYQFASNRYDKPLWYWIEA